MKAKLTKLDVTQLLYRALRFWNYLRAYPRSKYGEVDGQVVFVLPKDYGFGRDEHNM